MSGAPLFLPPTSWGGWRVEVFVRDDEPNESTRPWRWRLTDPEGQVYAVGGGYASAVEARRVGREVRRTARRLEGR